MFDLIVYIHGFRGSTESPKVAAMRQKFKDAKVVAPDYPDHDAHRSYEQLSSFIRTNMSQHPHMLLVGCSLGGFWAHYLSNQFKLPSLLLNPAMAPWDTLNKYVDGKFTERQVKAFKDFDFRPARVTTPHEPRVVLLEQGDDVIDPYATQRLFKGHADVRLLPNGSHRFDNMEALNSAIAELRNTIVHHEG